MPGLMLTGCKKSLTNSLEVDQFPGQEAEALERSGGALGELPADFIALILCCLPPRDIANSACVCRSFHAASTFDSVWESIALARLPPKYKELLALNPAAQFANKRELFHYLCANRMFFAIYTQRFWLDRETGGVCLAIAARAMYIVWGGDHRYWDWIPEYHNSLFPEVARLKRVCWFEVKGEIECSLPAGTYTLSWRILLGKLRNWRSTPATFTVAKDDGKVVDCKCFLDPRARRTSSRAYSTDGHRFATVRSASENGWREYDAGEFSVEEGEDSFVLKFSMTAVEVMDWKCGLCLDGVVVRPSNSISKVQPESAESIIRCLEVNDKLVNYHRFRR